MDLSKLKVFVDFDGTITNTDVGEAIFREFGDADKVQSIVDDLLDGKITARKCWDLLFSTIDRIDKNSFDNFISSMQIDSTFPKFYYYCTENKIDLFILSDGFDYYIQKILQPQGLNHIRIFANHLIIDESNRLIPSYPYFDIECDTSANCKRNHILSNSGDEDFTIYIGDGNSDKYSIEYCDFIFAKNDLLKYCEKARITYFPFNNFVDIIQRLETFKSKKRLKKRYQAELKRKEAFRYE